jgi:hypothetical protein
MSSKTNRPDRRSDYRHFPEAYSELFEQFKMNGTARLGPMPHTNALGGRRDLYRYRTYLISAVETDPDDDYARNLYDAARDVTMRVEGAGNRCFIVLELNPIVAAMRQPAGEPSAEGESRQAGEIESRQDHLTCPITTRPCTDGRCTSGWCQLDMSAKYKEHLP